MDSSSSVERDKNIYVCKYVVEEIYYMTMTIKIEVIVLDQPLEWLISLLMMIIINFEGGRGGLFIFCIREIREIINWGNWK